MYKRPERPPPSSLDTYTTSTPNFPSGRSPQNAEPLVLMSGYLTKRTRSVLQWKRRWWQLLGDGTLLYFKKPDRHVMQGQIDIAHTCYDVQLGADRCAMRFPRSTSPQCCFSFAILKRTYYVYAPTPVEANRWVESLTSASYLLNHNRPRELNANPAVLVTAETMGRSTLPPSLTPPSPKPPVVFSVESSSSPEEEETSPTIYSLSQILSHPSYHYSVPDLRFDDSSHSRSNPGLWLDGSPRKQHAQRWPMQRERALSQLTLANPYNSHLRDPETRRATVSSMHGRAAKRASTGFAFCDIPEHEVMDSDFGATGGTLPRQSKTKHPPSFNMVNLALGSSYERLEQLQEREDAIRLRLRELEHRSKAYSKKAASFPRAAQPLTTSSYSPVVLPSMATEAHYSNPEGQSSSLQQSNSSPQSKSLEERSSNQPKKLPKTPPKTPPKPTKTKQTPSPAHVRRSSLLSSNEEVTARDKVDPEKDTPPKTPPKPTKTKQTPSPAHVKRSSLLSSDEEVTARDKVDPEKDTPPKTPPKPTKTKQKPSPAHVKHTSLLSSNEEVTARDKVDQEKDKPQSPQKASQFPNQTDLLSSPTKDGVSQKQTTKFWGISTKSSAIRAHDANKWAKSEIRKVCGHTE